MEATYLQSGDTIPYTPVGAVAAGVVVTVGTELIGIATHPIAAGALGALAVRGIFDVAKEATTTWAIGDAVYFAADDREATKTTSDVYIGMAALAAAANDATVRVQIRARDERSTDGLGDLSDVGNATPTLGRLVVGDGAAWQSAYLSPLSLPVSASGMGHLIVLHAVCTAAGAEDEVVATCPAGESLKLIDCWIVARDTQAANVKLHKGTAGADDITVAVAKGTADDRIVRFTTLVDAKDVLAAGETLMANFSAAGSAEVFALCVRVTPE